MMLFLAVMTIVISIFIYKVIDMQYKIDKEYDQKDWHIKD